MPRKPYDPLAFVPSPDVIREELRDALTLAERLRLLLELSERLRLPLITADGLNRDPAGNRKGVRDVA